MKQVLLTILTLSLLTGPAFAKSKVVLPENTAILKQVAEKTLDVDLYRGMYATPEEKAMVLDFMATQSELSQITQMQDFKKNEGSIVYYNYKNKPYALVHYYLGDTEVGAIFDVSDKQNYKMLAAVEDGDVIPK